MGGLNPATVAPGAKVAVDTVAWIYFLERHPDHYATARELFSRVEAGEISAVMSSLVFSELLVPAYRAGDGKRAQTVLRLLIDFPNLRTVELSPPIAARAARLRARYGLRTPDTIHCATALESRCDAIVTTDKRFQRIEPELPVWLFR